MLSEIAGPGLYVVDADGHNLRKLSNRTRGYFAWAPMSDALAFAVEAYEQGEGPPTMCVAALDGSNVHDLHVMASEMTWSADGSQLAYQSWFGDNSDSEPRAVRMITPSGSADHLVADNAWNPAFSPVADRLAYVTKASHPAPYPTLAELRVLEAGRTTTLSDATWYDSQPVYSPDGALLASSQVSPQEWEHFGATFQDPSIVNHQSAHWSPDNRRFVGTRPVNPNRYDGFTHVETVARDGSDAQLVAEKAGSPDWSSGNVIAMLDLHEFRKDGSYQTDLEVVNPDGSGRHTLVKTKTNLVFQMPTWSPGGKYIAFLVTYNAWPHSWSVPGLEFEPRQHETC